MAHRQLRSFSAQLNLIQRKCWVIHYARKNSPGENGTNCAWIKPVFPCPTFTFKQGQNTKNDQINHFNVHPIDIYNEFKLNVLYSMPSSDDIHSFLRKQSSFWEFWL